MTETANIEREQRMHYWRLVADPEVKNIYFTSTPSLQDPALRPGLIEFWADHQRLPYLGPLGLLCTVAIAAFVAYRFDLKTLRAGQIVIGMMALASTWMTFTEIPVYRAIQRYVDFPPPVSGETVVEVELSIEKRSIRRSGEGGGRRTKSKRLARSFHVIHWKLDGNDYASAPLKQRHTPSSKGSVTGYVLKRPDGESYFIGFKAY